MDDFNKRRWEFVGGSDVAGILGLSNWNTPLSLWALKTQQYEDPFVMTEACEFGIELEDFVAKKFAQRTGKTVTVDETEYTHPEYSYMRAHIDRRVDGNEVLEAKTCSAYKSGAWDGDEIPEDYHIQLNWYLGIVGDEVGHIACLIGGQKFVYKEIKFNKELFDICVEKVKYFWETFVIPQQPPMAMSGDKDTLMELFPESRPDDLRALRGEDPELEATVNELALNSVEGKQQMKELEIEIDDSQSKLKQIIGDDSGVETGQWKCTWLSQGKSKFDIVKMKEDDVYDKYVIKGTTRVLRIKEKKQVIPK